MTYRIFPPEEMIEDLKIALPPSKSIATRSLILNALTPGAAAPRQYEIEACDDTRVIHRALETFRQAAPGERLTLDMDASGAATRFLTALFAATPGAVVELTGCPGLLRRPMGQLVTALRQCGANIEYLAAEGCAPLLVRGTQLEGGSVNIDATVSSQFISALMMVAPLMAGGLHIYMEGEPVSAPYIALTAKMMEQRGIEVEREPLAIKVPAGSYLPFEQPEQGDWSAAAFWYEISALSAGWITLTNLNDSTMQGDREAARFFECLGVLTEPAEEGEGRDLVPSPEVYGRLDLDLSDNPDLAPALAVTCCLIGVPFKFVGLQTLSSKESDRLEAICTEMDKIGRVVEKIRDYGLEWAGGNHPVAELPGFDAHGDHRMAMALAPVAIYLPGITVSGAETVAKSYPEYWNHLRAAGFTLLDPEEEVTSEE